MLKTNKTLVLATTLVMLAACRTPGQNQLHAATVTDEDLTTHLFSLRGDANATGKVFWEQCLAVNEAYECDPIPGRPVLSLPFPEFRRALAEAIKKDVDITAYPRAYGNLLGSVLAQGEKVHCPTIKDLVRCQHADYETFNNEFKWLKAAMTLGKSPGVTPTAPTSADPAATPKPPQGPATPPDDTAPAAPTESVTIPASVGTVSMPAVGAVAKHGRLAVRDGRIVGQDGKQVQLKGLSSHGLQWYGHFANYDSMKWLRDNLNINVFRAAMYTDEGGYLTNRSVKAKVKEIVDAAKELGLYVVIDWHILKDRDPMWHKNEAKEFFVEMATLYKDLPNVIYEIANEPNGGVTWLGSIKPYADDIVRTIRAIDPTNIIVVGTGTWSQDIHEVIGHTINAANIMYAVHFYAGTHGHYLRQRVADALAKGVGVFITECGVSQADGNGGVFWNEMKEWVNFLNNNGVSWIAWSLSDKNESSALLKPGQGNRSHGFDFSDGGNLIKHVLGM